jgi:hypothetical protein
MGPLVQEKKRYQPVGPVGKSGRWTGGSSAGQTVAVRSGRAADGHLPAVHRHRRTEPHVDQRLQQVVAAAEAAAPAQGAGEVVARPEGQHRQRRGIGVAEGVQLGGKPAPLVKEGEPRPPLEANEPIEKRGGVPK